LAQGFVGTFSGIGASLSTTFFGLIVGNFGSAIGFLSIAAAALTTVFLAWSLMPETKLPETKLPETKLPETKLPETKLPETKLPETKPSTRKANH
jgi:hypothetical protein